MSDNYSPVEIILDASTRSRRVVSGVGPALVLPDATQAIHIPYGASCLFMATIYKGTTTAAFSVPTGSVFLYGADDVFTSNHADPVVSLDAQFNQPGDWTGMNVANGKICWRANFATDELKAALNTHAVSLASVLFHHCLWMMPPGLGWVPIAFFDLYIDRAAVDPITAVQVDNITQLTTEAAAASYVPIWGDQAYERRKNGRTQILFPDGKWRARIGVIVDGQPTETWGDPED